MSERKLRSLWGKGEGEELEIRNFKFGVRNWEVGVKSSALLGVGNWEFDVSCGTGRALRSAEF